MEYYCIFVKAGIEERFKEKAQKEVSVIDESARFYFFTEEAWFKKAKLKNKIVRPAFPGYVFLKTQKLTNEVIHTVRHIEGFIRFLPVTEAIHKIDGDASQELINFIETGERHLMSKAVYEKGNKVKIISGDMKTFEAYIVHWDPQHQKVRVRLPNQYISWAFDLSYDVVIEKLPDDGGEEREQAEKTEF